MEWSHVGAALLSALLHAGWNAGVRAHASPTLAMAGQMQMAALVLLPVLAWTGLPASAAMKWAGLSTALNVLTVRALLRAYDLAPFGVAYPVSRALGVVLVVVVSQAVLGEALGPWAVAGVGLIVAALVVLAWGMRSDRRLSAAGLGWVLAAGVGIGLYVLVDAQGVRASGSPLAYCAFVSIALATSMALTLGDASSASSAPGGASAEQLQPGRWAWCMRRLTGLLALKALRQSWRVAVPCGLASTLSYLLILWVWTQAPVAPATALRDTSAVFALLIGVVWFRERLTPARALAIALTCAAVALMRWGSSGG